MRESGMRESARGKDACKRESGRNKAGGTAEPVREESLPPFQTEGLTVRLFFPCQGPCLAECLEVLGEGFGEYRPGEAAVRELSPPEEPETPGLSRSEEPETPGLSRLEEPETPQPVPPKEPNPLLPVSRKGEKA